jgi:3-oxoacyl-(acyl-carrier-protein) synthase
MQETLERLDEAVDYERSADDPERTVRLIHLGFILNEAKKYITSLQKEATDILLKSDWDQTPYQSKQFSMETKTGQPRKKWDHKGLGSQVARRIHDRSIDMDSDELLKSAEEQIQELLEYASPSYWRVTALKELGIDPDDYCEVLDPITNLIYRSNND